MNGSFGEVSTAVRATTMGRNQSPTQSIVGDGVASGPGRRVPREDTHTFRDEAGPLKAKEGRADTQRSPTVCMTVIGWLRVTGSRDRPHALAAW